MKHFQPLRVLGLMVLISLTGALQGCAAKAPGLREGKPTLTMIQPRETDGNTELLIEGTQPILQYTSFQLTEPLRLVVDITDADIGQFKDRITVNKGAVTDVSPSQMDNIARLEIGLTQSVETKVYQSGGKLMVEFGKPAEVAKAEPAPPVPQPEPPAAEKAPATEPRQAAEPVKGAASVVKSVKATAGKDGVTVVISANGAMKPNSFMLEGKRLVIDIPGARSAVRPSVISVKKGGIDRIRVGQHLAPDRKVRVVLDLTKTVDYTATPEGNKLVIAMNVATAPKPEVKPPIEKAAPQEPEKAPAPEKEAAPVPAPVTTQKAAAPPQPPLVQKEPVAAAKQQGDMVVIGGGRYSGKRMSLDFQDADLVSVMRLFAEVANLNIVLAPDVKGKITVRMVNIPWDQAMDIILKMNGLGYALEDNILRIASIAALTKESEEALKAKEAKKKAEDLITRMIPINYATAKVVEGTIKKSLSPRGDTVVDERTNTLIVKDIPQNVDDIVTLIKILDKPIPQVMIEARIVEAVVTFSREIGVQWGASAKAGAKYGNPTGFTFPNSIGMTGGPQMGELPFSTPGNYFVNLPAAAQAGAGGAIGFTFGSLSKALNLDIILSALEHTGEGKVISTPRVSALDNKEAKIQQGQSIPYLTYSASGTQVQFVDATLSLTVTPHVTPDNKIFLKIVAKKNAPDTSLVVLGVPSIRKNEAETDILLSDGETAVIGGILLLNRTTSMDKVPFFGDLPLIGWLFRKNLADEEKRELIIFITPKIMKQEMI